MPGNTPWRGYRIPSPGDQPDGLDQIRKLAMDVDADVKLLSTGMRLGQILHYTTSGTFAKGDYPGLAGVLVECVGAGGGAGYCPSVGSSEIGVGSPGGAGAFTRSWFDAAELASTETVTVGAGGAGGTSGTPDGDPGGDTTFGALVTAGGGGSGSSNGPASGVADGTSGGAASGSYVIGIDGVSSGFDWLFGVPHQLDQLYGLGSGGPYGQATAFPVRAFSFAGRGYGGGASGTYAEDGNFAGPADGNAGANGLVVVWAFIA